MEENRMETMDLRKLVLLNGIPLMLSLLINNLYNFVDSVFVSHVSEKALTALTLANPIQVLMSAMGIANAVGLNAVISRALGKRDEKAVRDGAAAAIWLGVVSWILLAVLSRVILKPYLRMQAGGDPQIVQYGLDYLNVVMFCSLGVMLQWVFDRFTMASGKSFLFLITLSSGAITNTILDPIFIFGYFGVPAMGVTGAAVATVIGQAVGAVMGIVINRKYNREIPIRFTPIPNFASVRDILRVGVPSGISQTMLSLMGMYVNGLLIRFSGTAVAVFGVCTKIQALSMVPIWGFDNGLVPLVAYNYGARKPERSDGSIRWTLLYELGSFAVIFLLLECFPGQILRIFDASEEMLGIGIPAIRILSISFLISVPSLVLSSALQGYGRGTSAMLITLTRQTFALFVFLSALQSLGDVHLIWWAYVCAELFALPLSLLMFRRIRRQVAREMGIS